MSENDRILVAGGGPVGYTAAYILARRGIPVTLLEAGDRIFDDPRAGTIHPPTLELFATIGITPRMLERGYAVRNYHYRDRKAGLIVDFDLGVLAGDTPYPHRLMLEQHKICAILRDALLREFPQHPVLLNHRVAEVTQDGDGVTAHIETPSGPRTMRGRYMLGCDGGRSQVRKSMHVDFEGFTYDERFLILSTKYDFEPASYALTNYIADPEQWCALFKVPGHDETGTWRVVFPVDSTTPEEDIFAEANVQRLIQGFEPKSGTYDVVHRNIYQVHQRVASRYRDGRILIAGDAAHINNPLGGMGMNFGFHDVFNLTEKLEKIWHHGASEDLFDLYDRQRRTVAQEYLQRQTIENKKNMENKDAAGQARFYDELRAIVADREKARAYLRRVAMIEGFERAAAIT
ncbi:MAG: FAD-dependent oxidoreductase [Alphaproteobacteria bacterium]